MIAIYKKELKSYFTNIIACLFIAINVLASGIAFIVNNLKNDATSTNNTELETMITIMSVVFLVAIPILVMRSFAEEKNQKTDQLLLTTPISIGKIIFGKFLAILTIYIIPIVIMCIYPLLLKQYGEINLKLAYTNIGGLALYGIVLISVCMFISALTEMQVIAATVSAVVLAIGWAIGYFSLTDYISQEGNILTKIISCFDLFSPLKHMFTGLIDIRDIVFYLTVIILFLFLTYEAIQKRRWSVSVKNIGIGIFSILLTVIMIAIVVFSNVVLSYATENKVAFKWDVTANNVYGISKDTKEKLSKLDHQIDIYVLSPKKELENDKDLKKQYGVDVDFSLLTKTLDRYSVSSSEINVEYVDLNKNPNFLQKYDSAANLEQEFIPYGIIVYDTKTKKSKAINFFDIYDIQNKADPQMQQLGMSQFEVANYDAEGQINSAIDYVQSSKTNMALFAINHGEIQGQYDMGLSQFFKEFETHNITIDQTNLVKNKLSADKCQLLVIFGPQKDYSKKETEKIKKYLLEGGKVVVVLDTDTMKEEKTNLYKLLAEFNIKVNTGFVYDKENNAEDNGYFVLSTETQGFNKDVSEVLSPFSIGITKKDKKNEDDSYLAIASSSSEAFLTKESDVKKIPKYKKGDKKGPFDTIESVTRNLAATESSSEGTDKADAKQAQMLVFASAYGLTDKVSSSYGGDSITVVSNALDEYIDTGVETVNTEKKPIVNTNIIVPSKNVTIIPWALVGVVPVIDLIAGIVVWLARRKK